jgi:hypothetical protein
LGNNKCAIDNIVHVTGIYTIIVHSGSYFVATDRASVCTQKFIPLTFITNWKPQFSPTLLGRSTATAKCSCHIRLGGGIKFSHANIDYGLGLSAKAILNRYPFSRIGYLS